MVGGVCYAAAAAAYSKVAVHEQQTLLARGWLIPSYPSQASEACFTHHYLCSSSSKSPQPPLRPPGTLLNVQPVPARLAQACVYVWVRGGECKW